MPLRHIRRGGFDEEVKIGGGQLAEQVVVGDFYGNPVATAIDPGERWCVTVGCGLVAYRLGHPWMPYRYDVDTDQWWEYGRDAGETIWLRSVRHGDDDVFTVTSVPDENWVVGEYAVRCGSRSVTLSRSWVAEAERDRAQRFASLTGAVVVGVSITDGIRIDLSDGSRLAIRGDVGLMYTGDKPPVVEDRLSPSSPASALSTLDGLVGRSLYYARSNHPGSLTVGFESLPSDPEWAKRWSPTLFIDKAPGVGSWLIQLADGSFLAPEEGSDPVE